MLARPPGCDLSRLDASDGCTSISHEQNHGPAALLNPKTHSIFTLSCSLRCVERMAHGRGGGRRWHCRSGSSQAALPAFLSFYFLSFLPPHTLLAATEKRANDGGPEEGVRRRRGTPRRHARAARATRGAIERHRGGALWPEPTAPFLLWARAHGSTLSPSRAWPEQRRAGSSRSAAMTSAVRWVQVGSPHSNFFLLCAFLWAFFRVRVSFSESNSVSAFHSTRSGSTTSA
jgi:hypothetical protein